MTAARIRCIIAGELAAAWDRFREIGVHLTNLAKGLTVGVPANQETAARLMEAQFVE